MFIILYALKFAMKEFIEKELENLPDHFVVLAILPSKHFENINLHLLNILVNKQRSFGSYITINRPYKNMLELLKSRSIDTKKLYFIDCITQELREDDSEKGCYYVNSPSDLTELAIALDPVFKKEKHEFIFLDSLDTLLIYNDMDRVVKFAHFLTGKIRMHKLKGFFLALHEKSDERLIAELSRFCDKVIDLSGQS